MSKGKRRRYIRHEHKDLKDDFSEDLKKLSKTEGRVLIKMIERNLDKPFYEVIREHAAVSPPATGTTSANSGATTSKKGTGRGRIPYWMRC